MNAVSRETLAQAPCLNRRRYHSPYRRKHKSQTREVLIATVLGFLAEGRWRPTANEIGARARCHPATVNVHFGSIRLLYRSAGGG